MVGFVVVRLGVVIIGVSIIVRLIVKELFFMLCFMGL